MCVFIYWLLCNVAMVSVSFIYVISLVKDTDQKAKFDELVEDKGVKILIDPKALMHVIGTKMDFVDDKLR